MKGTPAKQGIGDTLVMDVPDLRAPITAESPASWFSHS
jgi:hypothetical protein